MTPERLQKIKDMLDKRQPDLTVLMEDVHKPHNLAAIARTCDAVGIMQVHAVTSLESIRLSSDAASGSGRWVDVKIHSDLPIAYRYLRQNNFTILAAHFDEDAVDYREIDFTKPTALVVGQELDGLSQTALNKADHKICIPMVGMVQSLNVSVATAIILAEAYRQRDNAGMYSKRSMNNDIYKKLLFELGYPRMANKCREKNIPYPDIV